MRDIVAWNSSGATRDCRPDGNVVLKLLLMPKLSEKDEKTYNNILILLIWIGLMHELPTLVYALSYLLIKITAQSTDNSTHFMNVSINYYYYCYYSNICCIPTEVSILRRA